MTTCTGYVRNYRTETDWDPIRCVKVADCWSSGWEHLTPAEIEAWGLTRGEESRQAVLRERASRSQRGDLIETGLEASLGQAEQKIEELNAENAQLRRQVADRKQQFQDLSWRHAHAVTELRDLPAPGADGPAPSVVDQVVALWGNPANHADGTVYRVRKEWRGLAALLDALVDERP
jgi:cell division protein FtsB